MSLSYRNQSIDLQSKSMDWLLHDRDLRHGRVKFVYIMTHTKNLYHNTSASLYKCFFHEF